MLTTTPTTVRRCRRKARLVAAAERVVPFNEHAAKAQKTWPPTLRQNPLTEKVWIFLPADQGRTTIQLQNAQANRGADNWLLEDLPYLTQWKNTVAKSDGYVTGLEPGTSFPHNRKWERAKGRVSKLAPGQSRSFAITFGIQTTQAEVAEVAQSIRALQGNRQTRVFTRPEADPFPGVMAPRMPGAIQETEGPRTVDGEMEAATIHRGCPKAFALYIVDAFASPRLPVTRRPYVCWMNLCRMDAVAADEPV